MCCEQYSRVNSTRFLADVSIDIRPGQFLDMFDSGSYHSGALADEDSVEVFPAGCMLGYQSCFGSHCLWVSMICIIGLPSSPRAFGRPLMVCCLLGSTIFCK